jgi:putative transposase
MEGAHRMIAKAIQIRLYPNKAQAHAFRRWQGGLRRLWNDMLAASKAQHETTGKFMSKKELQAFAVGWKRAPETTWGAEIPAHAILALAADMHRAFVNFFERRARFPRFRGRDQRQFSIYAVNQATRFAAGHVKLPKLDAMRWRGGALPEGRLVSARIWQDAGERWMLSAAFECEAPVAPQPTVERVGIDVGIRSLATLFDGATATSIAAGRRLKKAERRLRRAQRCLSRRLKDSRRRAAAKARVAAIHRRVRFERRDLAHQVSGRVVRGTAEIRIETLDVKNMMKGNRHIARQAADAGMSEFLRQLRYKAEWFGRSLVEVDQAFASTQTCCACGVQNPLMKSLSRRMFRCDCGYKADRDINAAINLSGYGEERRNRAGDGPTRVEIGEQAAVSAVWPAPIVEARMFTVHWASAS